MRKSTIIKLLMVATLLIGGLPVYSQNGLAAVTTLQGFIYGAGAFVLLAIIATVYLVSLNNKYQYEANIKAGKADAPTGFRKWWSELDKKYFTKAAAVEQEADVLLDHDYDGIKELDNALPPWWKYGFYVTIVAAVIYLMNFHVLGIGKNPEQEYAAQMQEGKLQEEAYKAKTKNLIDEDNVKIADAAGTAEGKKIYLSSCVACHGPSGEGGIGPNLTDEYWLHGGSMNDIYKTIKLGYPEKGMQSWQAMFSPVQMNELASYVKSLKGTKPSNPKAPQGEPFKE